MKNETPDPKRVTFSELERWRKKEDRRDWLIWGVAIAASATILGWGALSAQESQGQSTIWRNERWQVQTLPCCEKHFPNGSRPPIPSPPTTPPRSEPLPGFNGWEYYTATLYETDSGNVILLMPQIFDWHIEGPIAHTPQGTQPEPEEQSPPRSYITGVRVPAWAGID